jgi:hypothetical protein
LLYFTSPKTACYKKKSNESKKQKPSPRGKSGKNKTGFLSKKRGMNDDGFSLENTIFAPETEHWREPLTSLYI